MRILHCTTLLALTVTLALACDSKEAPADDKAAQIVAEANDEAEAAVKKSRGEREKKDRGEASVKLGDTLWTADSAKWKLKGTTLTIKASNTEMEDGNVTRQELHLTLKDYAGPGEYKTGMHGSRFIGVGMNTADVAKAEGDDKKAAEEITKALSSASHMMLANAVVKVESATDEEIRGTFSYTPAPKLKQPALTDGTFRALLRKPRKKD